MSDNKNVNQDKGLQENEKIEQAIAALQQEATQEMLAHTLTVIRYDTGCFRGCCICNPGFL